MKAFISPWGDREVYELGPLRKVALRCYGGGFLSLYYHNDRFLFCQFEETAELWLM